VKFEVTKYHDEHLATEEQRITTQFTSNQAEKIKQFSICYIFD